MIQVQGGYDGELVRPDRPLGVPPNSRVTITLREEIEIGENGGGPEVEEREAFFDKLEAAGLLFSRPTLPSRERPPFEPIKMKGPPLSQAIIEGRGPC